MVGYGRRSLALHWIDKDQPLKLGPIEEYKQKRSAFSHRILTKVGYSPRQTAKFQLGR